MVLSPDPGVTSSPDPADEAFQRNLGDGLVLRWSTAGDTERIATLYSQVFRDEPGDPTNRHIATWTRDMMSGRHPLIGPGDFAVVEDATTGAIVASTCLLAQVWEYEGIPIPVGRPEVVATDERYRNRGLIRAIFALIHARSAAWGHLAQGITGIRYFYRQFGYEYALDLAGNRSLPFSAIPPLRDGAVEPFQLRAATPQDIPTLQSLYAQAQRPALVSTRLDAPYWRWVLGEQSPDSVEGFCTHLVLDRAGRPVGYVLSGRWRWGANVNVWNMGVGPGVPLVAVLPPILRALRARADTVVPRPGAPPASGIYFGLGRAHPAYEALGDLLPPASRPPYVWYVRVPDLPAFIRQVRPALERRLASSALAGYSGELCLDFYRGGLRLVFDAGRLTAAEDWRVPLWGRAGAAFPPLVFLQLLFGHRDLDELRYAFPDVWAEEEAVPLLRALFPSRPSWVMPLD